MIDTPLLRYVPAWDNNPFGERLNLSIKALRIHGVLTDKEADNALRRLTKKLKMQQEAKGALP